MSWRFKKEVVIGGVNGHELKGLAQAITQEAVMSQTVYETMLVLRQSLNELELMYPDRPSTFELCEVPGPPPPRPEKRTEFA